MQVPVAIAGDRRGARCAAGRARDGYTLIELVFVVFIIALVLSIAMPRFMPAMLYSQLEGSARHLANYGRSAVAYSAMNREPITVRFDLEKGEYWCLRYPLDEMALPSQPKINKMFDDDKDKAATHEEKTNINIQELVASGATQDITDASMDAMYQLDMAFRHSLEAQAKNVPHDGLLDEIGPLFEKEFTLDKEGKDQREEVSDALLDHGKLPEGIVLDSILLGGEELAKGPIDIEVTPLGLSQAVSFFLKGPDNQYYTVAWDPITGGAHLAPGKEAGNALQANN